MGYTSIEPMLVTRGVDTEVQVTVEVAGVDADIGVLAFAYVPRKWTCRIWYGCYRKAFLDKQSAAIGAGLSVVALLNVVGA